MEDEDIGLVDGSFGSLLWRIWMLSSLPPTARSLHRIIHQGKFQRERERERERHIHPQALKKSCTLKFFFIITHTCCPWTKLDTVCCLQRLGGSACASEYCHFLAASWIDWQLQPLDWQSRQEFLHRWYQLPGTCLLINIRCDNNYYIQCPQN